MNLDAFAEAEADRMDTFPISSVEKHNNMAARLRRAEQQHSEEKLAWKLKLECAVAQARQALREKEEFRTQFEELSKEHYKLSRHNLRLEEQLQQFEKEFQKTIVRKERELGLEIAELAAQKRIHDAEIQELKVKFQVQLEEKTKELKLEKEDLSRKLFVQRGQDKALKDAQKTIADLAEVQQQHVKENVQLAAKQQQSIKEIAQLKAQLKAAKEREKEVEAMALEDKARALEDKDRALEDKDRALEDKAREMSRLNQELETLREQLLQARQREKDLSRSVLELSIEKADQVYVMQRQDEETALWKKTSSDLERCVDELLQLEKQSAASYRSHMDAVCNSMKSQLEAAADEQDLLAASCTRLQKDVATWRAKCSELEKLLSHAATKSEQDATELQALIAKFKDQQKLIHEQSVELEEWKEAAAKLEDCVRDALKMEAESAAHYQKQIKSLKEAKFEMAEQIRKLEIQKLRLQAENAGLRLDEELGLEAVYTYESVSKLQELEQVPTLSTKDDDSFVKDGELDYYEERDEEDLSITPYASSQDYDPVLAMRFDAGIPINVRGPLTVKTAAAGGTSSPASSTNATGFGSAASEFANVR